MTIMGYDTIRQHPRNTSAPTIPLTCKWLESKPMNSDWPNRPDQNDCFSCFSDFLAKLYEGSKQATLLFCNKFAENIGLWPSNTSMFIQIFQNNNYWTAGTILIPKHFYPHHKPRLTSHFRQNISSLEIDNRAPCTIFWMYKNAVLAAQMKSNHVSILSICRFFFKKSHFLITTLLGLLLLLLILDFILQGYFQLKKHE